MSRLDLLPSICLGALLAASAVDGAVAAPPAGPATRPAALLLAAVKNEPPAAAPAEAPAPPATPAPTTGAASPSPFSIDVKVPTVETINSSMSDVELTRVFGGDIAGQADKLAALNAASIRVPEISITVTMPAMKGGSSGKVVYDYKNIDFEGISNGIAQSASVGGVDGMLTSAGGMSPEAAHFQLGKLTANDFDIGAMLGFYGYGPDAAGETVRPIYKNFTLAGGGFSAKDGHCSFGATTSASFSARPLKMPLSELMTLVTSPEMQRDPPPPDTIAKFVLFYADFFSAVQSAPATIDGIDCAGTDEHNQAFDFKTGSISVGGFGNDRYPAVTVKNFALSTSGDQVSLDNFTMKGIDLSGPIHILETAAKPLTTAWFNANARKLVPAFDGFSLSGLRFDVSDSENASQRIKGGVGDFDLTLGDYLDGVPMSISTSAHHAAFDVPAAVAGTSDQYDALRQMGFGHLDLGYDFAIHHDAATKSIVIDKLGVSGVNLGGAVLAATLGNADGVLFATDTESATAAAMAMTFKSARLDLTDAGLGDIIFKQVAAEQGLTPAGARTGIANMAQGLILAGLASNPDAKALGDAVGQFLSAANRSLSVAVSAKDPAGLGMIELGAAADNPAALGEKLSISATAK